MTPQLNAVHFPRRSNLVRRFALLAAFLGASLLPGLAFATSPHGVLSGLDVKYDGQGPNKLFIDSGNAYVDGVAVAPAAKSGTVSTTFCTTTGTTLTTATANFYVYYAFVSGGANNNFYISSTHPVADGHPSAAITGSNNLTGCNFAASTSAIFLGSYVTDGSGNIVPFNRNGDEVILTPAAVTTTYLVGGYNFQEVQFKTTDTYPDNITYDLSTLSIPASVPWSATAVILDLLYQDDGNNVDQYSYILDPHWPTLTVSGTGCSYHSQFTMNNFNLSTGNMFTSYYHQRIRNDGTKIYFGQCKAGTKEVDVWVTYYGYVEPIQHLTGL